MADEVKPKSDGNLNFNVGIENLEEAEARIDRMTEKVAMIDSTLSGTKAKMTYSEAHFNIVKSIMEMSQDSAPVELAFGYVDVNNICTNGIVIRKAPSSVIKKIMALPYDMVTHLELDGLHIGLLPFREELV